MSFSFNAIYKKQSYLFIVVLEVLFRTLLAGFLFGIFRHYLMIRYTQMPNLFLPGNSPKTRLPKRVFETVCFNPGALVQPDQLVLRVLMLLIHELQRAPRFLQRHL